MENKTETIRLPDHSADFETLEKMEWSFSKGDISYFKTVLDSRPSIVLRIHAVCMLADMKNEKAIPVLSMALREDPSPLVRHEAAFAMGQLEFKSGVPSLIEAMTGDERARKPLITMLDDGDEDVRLSAEVALADLDFLQRLRSKVEAPHHNIATS